MENNEIESEIEKLIEELMIKEEIEEYNIIFEGETEAGENYAGRIFFVKVIPRSGAKPYNLVVKTTKRDENLNKYMPVEKLYEREVLMYSDTFPTFKKLIRETDSGLNLDFLPKVYSLSDIPTKQTIIFENLKTKGFKLHDRMKTWDLDHSSMAMKAYGKFHALSLALRHQKPEKFTELASQMPDYTKEMNKDMDVKAFFKPLIDDIMKTLEKAGRKDLVHKYDGLVDEISDICNHDLESEDERMVISHADCWNNNFMFKYQDSKPTSICILDFQMSLPRTPVKDISYNIYSTCDKSTLNHFDELLQIYYESLSETLVGLGVLPGDVLTFDQLKDQWKKYGKYGLVTAIFILKITLVNKEDVPDFAGLSRESENMEEFQKRLNIKVKNIDEYMRRISDVFIHFGDNFL